MSNEMTTALGLDYTLSVRNDFPTAGRKTHEAIGITFQEEDVAPETPIITISGGSTLELASGGKGPCLPSPAPSHGEDFDFHSNEVRSGTACVEVEQPRFPIEEILKPMPSHVEGPPPLS